MVLRPIRSDNVAKQRDRDERHDGGREHRDQQKITRDLQGSDAVGEHKRSKNIEWCLLGQARERAQDDLLRLLPDHVEYWRTRNLALAHELGEDRRLHDPEPDIEANDH